MDLSWTEEEARFRAEFREWLTANLPGTWRTPGFWSRLDTAESFALRRTWERGKADAGWAGVDWSTAYGGRGGTPTMKAIHDEEMIRCGAPVPINALGHALLGPTVIAVGTERQRTDLITPTLRNDLVWCQGFSEPDAGSDLAGVTCRGTVEGDRIQVHGQKIWTTNAMHADKIFTMVRTTSGSHRHEGLSLLLIDMHQPGVEARPLRQMSGATEFGEVFFDGAMVRISDCLGGIGNGWRTAMLLLSFERGASGAGQYVQYRHQYDLVVDAARRCGRDRDPVVRQQLGRVAAELECVRYRALHVLSETERGNELGYGASITKLQWSHALQDLWRTFDDALGADATMAEPIPGVDLSEHHALAMWARSVTIWGGTSQVQRNIVAERILGLPR